MPDERIGYIHSLESFGSADGPGVRYIIFLSGCHMRCKYCHNPDTWKLKSGKEYTPTKLLEIASKYRPYWGDEGGITVSGGEPLLQIDFLLELFTKAKQMGINTTLDTSGNPFTTKEPFYSKWKKLMQVTDLVMLDIKHIDEKKHKELTGQSVSNILEMARQMSDLGVSMWIRHVLVPGINDGDKDLYRLSEFIHSLKTVKKVEILPYHTLGVFKWKNLGIPYSLEETNPPTQESVENAKKILDTASYLC